MRSGVPVVPLTINGTYSIVPKHSLRIRPGTVELVLSPPIAITAAEGKDAELELMEQVRAAIEREYTTSKEITVAVTIAGCGTCRPPRPALLLRRGESAPDRELNSILEYMDQLNRLDTSGVEPLAQVIDLQNVFRAGCPRPGCTQGRGAAERACAFRGIFQGAQGHQRPMSALATRTVVIIPARYASTRLPGKPLLDIAANR